MRRKKGRRERIRFELQVLTQTTFMGLLLRMINVMIACA